MQCIVKEKVPESHNVVTLKLICKGGIPKYHAGQYITIFLPGSKIAEGKAYTISNMPGGETIDITVKGIGEFSNRLCKMDVGDTIEASFPYGYFYSESETSTLVMIAGGIGVTPFRSMIADSLSKNQTRHLFLFYSTKTKDDIVFRKEFEALQLSSKFFVMKNFITKEEPVPEDVKKGRITVEDILKDVGDIADKEFLLCGSIPFVRDFWKGLKDAGVKEETIYTEAFF